MEKDFHFYTIYALAKRAGFTGKYPQAEWTEAEIIAYASQFVDDNNESQFIDKRGEPCFPDAIKMRSVCYHPIMTQSLSLKSLVYELQRFVYMPFHFLPGDNTVTIKKRKNPYSTTPGSQNATKLLAAALKSENPYRIGVALHTFADTWSHQNFSAYREGWNSVYPWYNIFKSYAPNIGHAEAGHAPDEISSVWEDHRFKEKIVNKHRALEATKTIYTILQDHKKTGPKWSKVKSKFREIISANDYDDRIRKIVRFVGEPGLKYDGTLWVSEAIDNKNGDYVAAKGFKKSHWYRFQEAAKWQLAFVMDILGEL